RATPTTWRTPPAPARVAEGPLRRRPPINKGHRGRRRPRITVVRMPVRLPRLPLGPRLGSLRRGWRPTRRRVLSASIVLGLILAVVAWVAWPSQPSYETFEEKITVLSGPSGTEPVELDTTFYLPRSASAENPVPAILLAHGFGGTKHSVASDAGDFADRGYAVLTWSARGFGESGGEIHLNSPDYEIRDAQRLIDWLAARPEIAKDSA